MSLDDCAFYWIDKSIRCAKVNDLDISHPIEHDVRGLQIVMGDALAMHVRHGIEELQKYAIRFMHWQAIRRGMHDVCQCAIAVLHDQIPAVMRSDKVDGAGDVGMGERSADAELVVYVARVLSAAFDSPRVFLNGIGSLIIFSV